MEHQLSKEAKNELLEALRSRYHGAFRQEKALILDQVMDLANCHRKHAIRLLSGKKPAASAPAAVHRRLYVNCFQPSFQLLSKKREGAKVKKTYRQPATPCARLLAYAAVPEPVKTALRCQEAGLDPLELLHRIRDGQRRIRAPSRQGSYVRCNVASMSGAKSWPANWCMPVARRRERKQDQLAPRVKREAARA